MQAGGQHRRIAAGAAAAVSLRTRRRAPSSSFRQQRSGVRQGTQIARASAADDDPSSSGSSSWPIWEEEEPKPLPPNYAEIKRNVLSMDNNQLQTALSVAIAAEDYQLASRIKERLQQKLLDSGSSVVSQPMDWRALGVPEWLADRAERLGFLFPTEVQRRSTPVILSGVDAVIASETGSGKTAACLVPALSQLDYPPELFPDDLEGPQLLLLVPSFELGVQACLLLYKIWGGNISNRTPGDPANMFTYTGPAGIKVRGLLNDEELQMAIAGRYLQGVHALVATPDLALALLSLTDSPLSFQDLRVVVVDEVDALREAYPASFGQVMDAAVSRRTPQRSSQPLPGDPGADAGADGGGDGPQDQLARLRALLEKQQQQPPGPGGPANAGMTAAAARLEGLLAAPAAEPAVDPAQQSQQQEQQQQPSSPGAVSPAEAANGEQQQSGSDDAEQSQAAADAAALAASQDNDTPMPKPQVVLVGATVSDEDVLLAVQRRWMEEPVLLRVGAPSCVPGGLRHRALVVAGPDRRLWGLVSSLRRDLAAALAAADAAAASSAAVEPDAAGGAAPAAAAAEAGGAAAAAAPVRVMIFAQSEAAAVAAADPLRSALWGDHMLAVLLPSSGAEPIKALQAFRDRVASMLLCTPSAARGLDLPAVSHVYCLGPPADSAEYVHRAGRAGRIGSTAGGEVCSVVTRAELPGLQGMLDELGLHLEVQEADQPGLALLGSDWDSARQALLSSGDEIDGGNEKQQQEQQEQQEAGGGQLETARKGLEDLFNLF